MCTVEPLKSWDAFKERLNTYLSKPPEQRQKFFFRGHANDADQKWSLSPTIDRLERTFDSDQERENFLAELLRAFQEECHGLWIPGEYPDTNDDRGWEFLGRHHGLPTTILDWTQSPYAGAFFAFEQPTDADAVSVWVLNTTALNFEQIDGIEWDSFEDTIRYNIRAAEQRGASMRVKITKPPVEKILADGLIRLDIPASERVAALADLDEMQINGRSLFRDLGGAARTAAIRKGAE